MRRIVTGILILALLLPLSGCLNQEKDIDIDREHFPDEVLWEAARKKDLDHNTKLSSDEIESATKIYLDGVQDLTGLEVFTSLDSISLRNGKNMKYDFKCFTNLRSIAIDGTWAREHEGLVRTLFAAFILVPSAFNYWLSYRCFRRAQVITDKPTRL